MLPAELLRQQIVARIPGSRLIFLDCGHEIRLEKPWEAAALIDITAIRKPRKHCETNGVAGSSWLLFPHFDDVRSYRICRMFLLLINFLQTVFDVIMDALTLLRLMFRSNGSARRQESLSAQTYGAVHRMRWAGGKRPAAFQPLHPSLTSSVRTLKLFRVLGPKVLLMATSAASRPRAINTRPMRGILLRASKVYQWPSR
jgi:hypothetical protein